jgi:hypothetical protein
MVFRVWLQYLFLHGPLVDLFLRVAGNPMGPAASFGLP